MSVPRSTGLVALALALLLGAAASALRPETSHAVAHGAGALSAVVAMLVLALGAAGAAALVAAVARVAMRRSTWRTSGWRSRAVGRRRAVFALSTLGRRLIEALAAALDAARSMPVARRRRCADPTIGPLDSPRSGGWVGSTHTVTRSEVTGANAGGDEPVAMDERRAAVIDAYLTAIELQPDRTGRAMRRLSQLFERARYSRRSVSANDAEAAMALLREIETPGTS